MLQTEKKSTLQISGRISVGQIVIHSRRGGLKTMNLRDIMMYGRARMPMFQQVLRVLMKVQAVCL